MDSEKFVEEVFKTNIKDRVLSILEFPPPAEKKEFEEIVDRLFSYSTLPEVDTEVIKNKFAKEFQNYKHILIFLQDWDIENIADKIKLKGEVYNTLLEIIKKNNYQIWLHILLMEDIKNISMDSQFILFDSLLGAKPLYDKGLYEVLKLALTHKQLLLEIFGKYVVAYVLAGSYVKGRASETSDVDVYVVIDDTDVKLHTFVELKQKLYARITEEAMKAMVITQSKKILHPQVYTLTEFWLSLSESNPVIITFLRDGIALYDRGMYIAWKQLLLKGIIKPSKEAAEKYLSLAETTLIEVENKMKEILIQDIAVSMLTAAQAVLMNYGLLPTDPKETPMFLRKLFLEEKKMLEEEYIKDLEEIWKIRKDFEHEKPKEIKGSDIDKWLDAAKKFLNRMKNLKKAIDKEKEKEEISYYIQEMYSLIAQLEDLYKESIESIFEKRFKTELSLLKDLLENIKLYREGKLDIIDISKLRNDLTSFNRFLKYLIENKKASIMTNYLFEIVKDNKKYDVYITEDSIFVISEKIERYDYSGKKIAEYERSQFDNIVLKELNEKGKNLIDKRIIEAFNNIFGEYEILK